MRLEIPLRLTGSLNSREHWSARARRVKAERTAVALAWPKLGLKPSAAWFVTLTRVAPRLLDSDNLAGRLKGVRDQVAAQLGLDDGSARLFWAYEQTRGAPHQHAVQIEVTPWPVEAAPNERKPPAIASKPAARAQRRVQR